MGTGQELIFVAIILNCLLDIQREMSSRQLDIRVQSSEGSSGLQIYI